MNWILLLILLAAIVLFVKASNRGQNVWSYFVVAGAIFLYRMDLVAETLEIAC
jgi:hypothetical protein